MNIYLLILFGAMCIYTVLGLVYNACLVGKTNKEIRDGGKLFEKFSVLLFVLNFFFSCLAEPLIVSYGAFNRIPTFTLFLAAATAIGLNWIDGFISACKTKDLSYIPLKSHSWNVIKSTVFALPLLYLWQIITHLPK